MSSQEKIPQTITTMEAAFTLHEGQALQEEFWKHQERMGPIAAASPGFISVIGGPIHRSHWLYFSGKWATPMDMDAWQQEPKHKPMQQAAHSRWFSSVYLRKWRLPAPGEVLDGPLLCELAIARQEPLADEVVDMIVDERIHPSLRQHGALPFETLTGTYEKQPFQFVGPLQEFPALAPVRYLLVTHWATHDALQNWLKSSDIEALAAYGEVASTISVPIKHDPGERDWLRPDGLQRDAVHA
jgi:heme-degrading monooxygenase HmoA